MLDTRLMTYAEMAEALGIGGDSARALVRRKRWHRKPGNDGCTRVEVPVEYLNRHDGAASPPASLPAEPPASPPAEPPASAPSSLPAEPPASGEVMQRLERLERALEALQAERNEQHVMVAVHAIERERHAAEVARLESILAVERARVDELLRRRGLWGWLRRTA
jgi:hypothetical protein